MRNVLLLIATLAVPAVALAAPSWTSDFESGNLSAWSKIQAVAQDRTAIVENPVREGTKALKVTVRKGDDPINSGNDRAELINMTLEPKGSEYYYRFSVMFPENYPSHPKWQLFTQWHQEGLAGTPPLEIYVVGEELRLRAGGHEGPVLWTAPLQRGTWQDFILRVKWSDSPSEGFVELFHNGKVALPKTMAATQLPGQLNYMKIGLYRSKEITAEGTIYFDDIRMGTALEDVLPTVAQGEGGGTDTGSGGGWTSGNVVENPTTDPDGPNEGSTEELTPEDLAAAGCSSSSGSTLPFAAAVALLGMAALVRRRRVARVTVPVTGSKNRR